MKKFFLISFLSAFIFLLGIITSHLKVFPYYQLKNIYEKYLIPQKDVNEVQVHFVDPISTSFKLKYKPVSNYEQLNYLVNKYCLPIHQYDSAYDDISILSHFVKNNIIGISYSYLSHIDTVYALFKKTNSTSHNIGIIVIPGTGINQSEMIYSYNDINKNYQCNIDDISIKYGDCYILVKPNEDFLAIHDGMKKISSLSFVNYLLNKRCSYSVYYMIQSLALSKYIKSKHEKHYVIGLSQGGHAALLNSIQSSPDKAFIASGFSVLRKYPFQSENTQLIIPSSLIYDPDFIKSKIRSVKTDFMFTYGLSESGSYGKEAREKVTELFFKDLNNTNFFIHPKGHIYYEPAVVKFFESN